MNEEEFEKYREEVIGELKSCRNDIEEYPDDVQIRLQVVLDKHRDICEEEIFSYTDIPFFFHMVDKELYYILSHLSETGEWRIPSAISHFDGLLSYFEEN